MTSCAAHDADVDTLDQLITLAPDPARAARVRARCRAQLERRQRRVERTTNVTGFGWRVLAPVVVGAVCVFYTAVLVALTVQLEAIFN